MSFHVGYPFRNRFHWFVKPAIRATSHARFGRRTHSTLVGKIQGVSRHFGDHRHAQVRRYYFDPQRRRGRQEDPLSRSGPCSACIVAHCCCMLEHAFNFTLHSFGRAGCLLNFMSSLVCCWLLVPKRLESAWVFRRECGIVV